MALPLRVKWFLFRLLELGSEVLAFLKGKPSVKHPPTVAQGPAQSLWIFASTIGELSAIDPLLQRMQQRLPNLSLTLLSDHDFYEDSFLAKYPAARFRVIDHRTSRVRSLMDEAPPALVVLAEIPCLLSEAPCRLPFALAFEAKKRGAKLCLVNGWLYQQQPNSRMDAIEKHLFERRYLQLFDVMTVQTDAIRQVLIESGADGRRVFVTGNVKFDALDGATSVPANAKSAALLGNIARSGRPVLTAGSVTNVSEQELVLDAFRTVCNLASNPLLVLAPRYPHQRERMDVLEELLSKRGYRFAFKSRLSSDRLDDTLQCLVLDTLGELKAFYAVSTISYVGLNKNVLEPLAFGKRVFVTRGWDPIRPGYSVSRRLVDQGFITEVQQRDLQRGFLEHLQGGTETGAPLDFRGSDEYRKLMGATDRCMARLEPILKSAGL
jgi:3-deoxy-D-manno-octulosonic-acid transferase